MMAVFSAVFLFLLGVVVGSFLNVLAWRLPEGQGVVRGRSHCRACGRILRWHQLIPVVSYLSLRGRCAGCGERISLQYPLVELATGLLFVAAAPVSYAIGASYDVYGIIRLVYTLFSLSVLVVVFVTDLRLFLILDEIIYPAIAVSFVVIFVNAFFARCQLLTINCSIKDVGLSLGGALFFLALVLASRGRWMGIGDIKLAAFMGLLLGPAKLFMALLMAFSAGSVIGLLLIALGRKTMKSEVPFGAFLAPATVVALLWGDALIGRALHVIASS